MSSFRFPLRSAALFFALIFSTLSPALAQSDELVAEALISLNASAYERLNLEQYLACGTEALGDFEASRTASSLTMKSDGLTFNTPWPLTKVREVAQILDRAAGTDLARKQKVVRGLASCAGDPFTAYLPPGAVARLTTRVESRVAAPGFELTPLDPCLIREVRPGLSLKTQNLEVGDRVITVAGKSAAAMTLSELNTELIGVVGSTVQLEIKKPSGKTLAVKAVRTHVPEPDVSSVPLPQGAVYIRLANFAPGVSEKVKAAIWSRTTRGVILDMRHNSGGLISEGVELLNIFLSKGNLGGIRPRAGRSPQRYAARHAPTDSGVPLVVLLDGSSASATEFVAMVLKERGRAQILGTPTLGKGSIQKRISMPDGGLLKVTTAKYFGPKGALLPDGGITPNRILAPPSGESAISGGAPTDDDWVAAAQEVLFQSFTNKRTKLRHFGPQR